MRKMKEPSPPRWAQPFEKGIRPGRISVERVSISPSPRNLTAMKLPTTAKTPSRAPQPGGPKGPRPVFFMVRCLCSIVCTALMISPILLHRSSAGTLSRPSSCSLEMSSLMPLPIRHGPDHVVCHSFSGLDINVELPRGVPRPMSGLLWTEIPSPRTCSAGSVRSRLGVESNDHDIRPSSIILWRPLQPRWLVLSCRHRGATIRRTLFPRNAKSLGKPTVVRGSWTKRHERGQAVEQGALPTWVPDRRTFLSRRFFPSNEFGQAWPPPVGIRTALHYWISFFQPGFTATLQQMPCPMAICFRRVLSLRDPKGMPRPS